MVFKRYQLQNEILLKKCSSFYFNLWLEVKELKLEVTKKIFRVEQNVEFSIQISVFSRGEKIMYQFP